MKNTSSEIALLIQSGWHLIALETFEEDRALRLLQRISDEAGLKLIPWSIASGIGDEGRGRGALEEERAPARAGPGSGRARAP